MKALLVILFLLLVIFGWPALVLAVYNSVAAALGLPLLTYWVMFGVMFLLGVIGSYFRSQAVKA